MATDTAAFEAHMIATYGPHINLARTPDGYAHSVAHRTLPMQYASIQMLWEAWREARAQPTRPAVVEPLTDEQIVGVMHSIPINAAPSFHIAFARAIEQAHGIGIKNGDSHA